MREKILVLKKITFVYFQDLVVNMPHGIGPELRLARPQTHHGYVSAVAQRREPSIRSASASGFLSSGSATRRSEQTSAQSGEPQIELLEYEWPDLPPIVDMKDAVCRKRVSQGINYLLPVDKGKNSIDSKFRTDLRAMFQEPYATEGAAYDDNRVSQSAKIHFKTNEVDTRWTARHLRNIPVRLNSDSEKARKLYAQSAPVGGRTNAWNDSEKLKTRSSLFLPIKARAHPEAQKLRREVENIIKSVQEDNDEYDGDAEEGTSTSPRYEKSEKSESPYKRKSIIGFRACDVEIIEETPDPKEKKFTAEDFNTYEELKVSKPPKLLIPAQFQSEFLTLEKNQTIWDWLHYGETITDFEYFISVCG